MIPNKGETAFHGYHCPGNMAVYTRKVLTWPWVGACVPLNHVMPTSASCRTEKNRNWSLHVLVLLYLKTTPMLSPVSEAYHPGLSPPFLKFHKLFKVYTKWNFLNWFSSLVLNESRNVSVKTKCSLRDISWSGKWKFIFSTWTVLFY